MAKLTTVSGADNHSPERKTLSGIPIEPVYTAVDIASLEIPPPGEFPYTRGIHESMYRGRLWTMRQFSGSPLPRRPIGDICIC